MTKPIYVHEYNEIVKVLNQYNEGGKKADSSIMKPAFSKEATIFGVDGDNKLTGGAIQGLFDTIDTAFRPSPEAQGVRHPPCLGGRPGAPGLARPRGHSHNRPHHDRWSPSCCRR